MRPKDAFIGRKAGENMATLTVALQIYDGMTPTLKSISDVVSIVTKKFKSLEVASRNSLDIDTIKAARVELTKIESACNSLKVASSNAINASSIQAATLELKKMEAAYDSIGDKVNEIANKQEEVKKKAAKSDGGGLIEKIKGMAAPIKSVFEKIAQLKLIDDSVIKNIKDKVFKAFDPIRAKIREITSSDGFNEFVNKVVNGITIISNIASTLIDVITSIASVFTDNWSRLGPIVAGLIAAFIAFNIVLYANPLIWIILILIALIAVVYAVIEAINHFAGTSFSAVGVIVGAFATAGAFIANLLMGILQNLFGYIEFFYNQFTAFANFFANIFNDPVGAIIKLFADLADNVLGVLEKIASGLDFIFGTKMADTVNGWRAELQVKADDMMSKYSNGKYEEKFKDLDINAFLKENGFEMERFNYGDAYNSGYAAGENFQNNFDLGSLVEGVTNTETNTASMANSMEVSSDELKYMRDLAEQEVINRFTTAEIKVEMNNQNNISSNMDLDGVVTYLEDKLYETMVVTAEGVHV